MESLESIARRPASLVLRHLTELGSEEIFISKVRRGHLGQVFSLCPSEPL